MKHLVAILLATLAFAVQPMAFANTDEVTTTSAEEIILYVDINNDSVTSQIS